ncbi:MAG: hypothetical protein J0I06_00150 [Planctomycetes bacterium]|nr:hypothetical protein [Planctomycetota bacterium]
MPVRAPIQDVKPSLNGRWKGYFTQLKGLSGSGGSLCPAEASFKQERDNVAGEFRIALADKPELFHITSVGGEARNGQVEFTDKKVVKTTSVAPSRWYSNRTFTGRVSEFGSISGSWTDPTATKGNFGNGKFALVRMDYAIRIKRGPVNDQGLIPGKLYLNETYLGEVYENPKFVIPVGEYKGGLRTKSGKNYFQGSGGVMGEKGDFLLEVVGVPKRTDILIHPGNKPEHSEGSILTGAVIEKGTTRSAPTVLKALRLHFYGEDKPASATPVYAEKAKGITIKIEDDEPQKP